MEPYVIPSKDDINDSLNIIKDLFNDFLKQHGDEGVSVYVNKHNLFEIIKRIDERMYYLKAIHQLQGPCEYKYVAMLCFWINTLKPFTITEEKAYVHDSPNEMFSLYLIISTIQSIFEKYKPEEEFLFPTDARMRDILYDFKYCSLSREAMIAFVETFADTYGVGIDFIQKNSISIEKATKVGKMLNHD